MAQHPFQKEHDRIMREARKSIDTICAGADEDLESVAIAMFGPVSDCPDDGFGPPKVAVQVECWHCGDKYSSSEMVRAYRPRCQAAAVSILVAGSQILTPLWWCKNIECDGGGYGHDIHKVRQSRKKSQGSKAA